jgi:phage recombination protein Bet
MFLYVCERTRLDPFTKQIHLVPRWDSRLGREVRMPIVGIDGLRSIGERAGSYAGNDDPVFDDESKPRKATVTVYKIVQSQRVGFTASARWDQYFPGEKQGFMWNKMPHLMLGKCAEALALRKAFPAVMSGLYVAEEMQQAGVVVPGVTAVAPVAQVENPFEKAKSMIKAIGKSGVEGLKEFKVKLAKSDKYSVAEKNQLGKMIDERLSELTEKEPANLGAEDDQSL